MLRSAFFLLRRIEAAALMLAGDEIEREGNLTICDHVPSSAVQHVAVDAGDAYALPAQPRRLPRDAVPSPCHDRVKADEQ